MFADLTIIIFIAWFQFPWLNGIKFMTPLAFNKVYMASLQLDIQGRHTGDLDIWCLS